ncbi:hypothetical protein CASP1_00039 [Alcaligenes phage CASP1]|nr:hypothetical protein CASP1_00039 [Alcaligenes phage CASP1]
MGIDQTEKWWCVDYGYRIELHAVEVVKETQHTVTILRKGFNGSMHESRANKSSEGTCYFKEFAKAKIFAMEQAQRRERKAIADLEAARLKINEITAMAGE